MGTIHLNGLAIQPKPLMADEQNREELGPVAGSDEDSFSTEKAAFSLLRRFHCWTYRKRSRVSFNVVVHNLFASDLGQFWVHMLNNNPG
jgi:hypothetical protein